MKKKLKISDNELLVAIYFDILIKRTNSITMFDKKIFFFFNSKIVVVLF